MDIDTPPHNPQDPPGQSIRVLTFNTCFARRLDEVSHLLREVRPDVAVLQEMLIYRYRGWTWHQAEGLARELGMNCVFQWVAWREGTDIGVALLSTGPMSNVAAIEGKSERPTGISARVSLAGQTINVAGVHFSHVPRPLILGYPWTIRTHLRQAARAIAHLEQLGGPTVLAGDLNTIPRTPAHRLICRHLNDIARQAGDRTGTRRTMGLPLRIDYIFASPHFTCRRYRVLSAKGSDHRPVMADLSLNESPD